MIHQHSLNFETFWGIEMTVNDYLDEIVNGLHPDIGDRPNVLLYGPPGTGKTFILQQLKMILSSGSGAVSRGPTPGTLIRTRRIPDGLTELFNPNSGLDGVRTWWLSFHQSMTYDDFILGLRPITSSSGTLELQPRAGPLFEAMEHAKSGGTSFIFIDEINRGNLPQILGDFITFMEYGKRLDEDGVSTPERTLSFTPPHLNVGSTTSSSGNPESEEIRFRDNSAPRVIELTQNEFGYEVPHHVYIIATMNSLDRSVAPIDSAIERRFNRIALKARPTNGEFTGYTNQSESWGVYPNFPSMAEYVENLLNLINREIEKTLDTTESWEFEIGPAVFAGIGDVYANFEYSLKYRLLPNLRKVLRNFPVELENLLNNLNINLE